MADDRIPLVQYDFDTKRMYGGPTGRFVKKRVCRPQGSIIDRSKPLLEDFEIRLIEGRGPHEGNVQFRRNGRTDWQPVCGRDWDATQASVVCAELGYTSVEEIFRDSPFRSGHKSRGQDFAMLACNEDLGTDMSSCGSLTFIYTHPDDFFPLLQAAVTCCREDSVWTRHNASNTLVDFKAIDSTKIPYVGCLKRDGLLDLCWSSSILPPPLGHKFAESFVFMISTVSGPDVIGVGVKASKECNAVFTMKYVSRDDTWHEEKQACGSRPMIFAGPNVETATDEVLFIRTRTIWTEGLRLYVSSMTSCAYFNAYAISSRRCEDRSRDLHLEDVLQNSSQTSSPCNSPGWCLPVLPPAASASWVGMANRDSDPWLEFALDAPYFLTRHDIQGYDGSTEQVACWVTAYKLLYLLYGNEWESVRHFNTSVEATFSGNYDAYAISYHSTKPVLLLRKFRLVIVSFYNKACLKFAAWGSGPVGESEVEFHRNMECPAQTKVDLTNTAAKVSSIKEGDGGIEKVRFNFSTEPWMPAPNDDKPWIQFNFEGYLLYSGIITQGGGGLCDCWVTTLKVKTYIWGTQMYASNFDASTPVTLHSLAYRHVIKYIHIEVIDYHKMVAFRLEIIGREKIPQRDVP